jgi:serine/threonine protein phosphatase 1
MTENEFIAVIGDLHGCFHTLETVYARLAKSTTEIYSVGDLVDRGKYAKETVGFCMDNNIKCVRGNHEDILLSALEHPEGRTNSASGYTNFTASMTLGGKATMKSYTGSSDENDYPYFKQELIRLGHLRFLNSFPLKYEFNSVVITHAGIVKGEDKKNWMWNRSIPSDIGKFQIFGHTPLQEPSHSPNRFIAIDTGCVYGNKLTAVIVNRKTGELIEIISIPLDPKDV